jgi:hypothetical protein
VSFNSYTTGETSGAGNAYISGAPEITSVLVEFVLLKSYLSIIIAFRGHGRRDRMVVGFTTTLCNQFLSPIKL